MMNSRWQVNKIGLIDFWYYDEEEFYFSEGRMLLRGSNGSGKSVTMQSFIPLLLDGNMRPERLDPFGSRARKMENYLLEENDDREERTGYLYMEFKREDSGTYLTIGIGMRARKAKKLETWYFIIQDGRRIRKDLYLYKDMHNKIPLSKQELRYKLSDGGKLIESQTEYMTFVNKLIFGFETLDEYKETIELLIQLRTPKLSKDFKPTTINEILSSSLQPLSEEDLRPMSEAIENMDSLKTNLDTLKQARDAGRKIFRVYDKYNQFMLFDKARQYKECADEVKDIEKAVNRHLEIINENNQRYKEAEDKLTQLALEEKVLKEEERSLNQSDAKRLKEREIEYINDEKDKSSALEVKNKNLDDKKEKYREAEKRKVLKEEENDSLKGDIEDCLTEMGDTLCNISFDEHNFMAEELLRELNKQYGFNIHESMLYQLIDRVDEGISLLNKEDGIKKNYDILLQALEQCRTERDTSERESIQLENQLVEIKSELLEKIYSWNDKNEVLAVDKQHLRDVSVMVENYSEKSDYSELREKLLPDKEMIQSRLLEDMSNWGLKKKQKETEIKETVDSLANWREKKDPEPERADAVVKNREMLREKGIEFIEFYKAVDFDDKLPPQLKDYLEEALYSMGILDALIVSADDRETILKLDKGLCDKYIFDDISHIKNIINEAVNNNHNESIHKDLNGWMNVVNPDNDEQDINIFIYQKISNVLSSISCLNFGHTAVHEDGSYQLGLLMGTITKEYQARFIGVRRREEYRQSIIKEHEDKLKLLEEELQEILGELVRLTAKKELLEQEWSDFPKGDDLKTALKLYMDSLNKLERLMKELKQKEENLKTEQQKLDIIKEEILNISGKLYLKARLDLFKEAKKELSEYQKLFNRLQISHAGYCNGYIQLMQYEDQLEGLNQDMDSILYDISHLKRELEDIKQNLLSIREQLKLTDYEQIKERLNYCVERLNAIPDEKKLLYRESQSALEQVNFNNKAKAEKEASLEVYNKKAYLCEEVFVKEHHLGYVSFDFPETKHNYALCSKIIQSLDGTFGSKKRDDYVKDVQEQFHANRGMLSEYYLIQDNIFTEYDENNVYDGLYFRRIELTAKYRGTAVKFHELLAKIENDIEEQNNLLNQKDRELFEDILANTISKKIRAKIYNSMAWVENMNSLMNSMKTSSGLTLSLRWKSKKAEHEDQLDTKSLVELLKKDAEIMKEEDFSKLSFHFRSKIQEARKIMDEEEAVKSFHSIMRDILDYRKWFEFQLEFQKTGESKKELTDRAFFTFSGGEKAMAMYVPLFSAVTAKYHGARMDAPRLISLDEAFAGVDETNIRDMFRLMVEFEFSFIINSQILWGDADTLPSIAIYQLVRPENVKYVTVIPYLWNGKIRIIAPNMEEYIEAG